MIRTLAQSACLLLAMTVVGIASAEEPPTEGPPAGAGRSPQDGAAGQAPQGLPGAKDVSPAEAVPSGQGLTNVLELSLQKALKMGAEFNLGIMDSSYEAPIAWQGRIAAEGTFDTLLTAGLSASHDEVPSTNLFTGTGVLDSDSVNGQVAATRLLRSGGSVSLLYRADRLNTNNPFATVNPAVSQGFSIEASQPLLRGAGDVALADIRRAQNNVAAAKAGYSRRVEATLLLIAEAYWNLVFAADTLSARRKSEEVARELLDQSNARLKAEVGTPLDVAEARAGVERRVSEVLDAENLRDTIQDLLLSLILPFGPTVRHAVTVIPTDRPAASPERLPTKADEQRYVDLALRGRPELLASRAEIATRGIDVKVAGDAIRPQLDIIGRVASDGLDANFGDSFNDVIKGRAVSGTIGLQFSMFVGRRSARANWLAAAWRRRQAMLRQKDLQNVIIVEVRGALRDLDTARGQLAAGKSEVKAAEEGLRGERLKQENGKSTPFRVLQHEEDLTAARTRESRAAADMGIAEVRLYRSVGSLAATYNIDTTAWKTCCSTRR